MFKHFRFPIRFKILVTLLVVITAVVTLITFIMANLFHADKRVYIHDLTAATASSGAEKTRALLAGYRDSLQIFSNLAMDRSIPSNTRSRLLQSSFEELGDFISIALYPDNSEPVTIFDAQILKNAGLDRRHIDDVRLRFPLSEKNFPEGELYVVNSTFSRDLPNITLAFNISVDKGRRSLLVGAMIHPDRLIELHQQTSIFQVFITDRNGNFLTHPETGAVLPVEQRAISSSLQQEIRDKRYGRVVELDREGKTMITGLAPVELAGLTAVAQVPRSAIFLTTRDLLTNMLYISLLLLSLAALLSLAWSRLITRPLERLSLATQELGKGRFDINVTPSSRDEIGELAQSFNTMAVELDGRDKALKQTQAALVQSEKMAAFGQLGAGIAHEVKNPLAGILGLAQLCLRKTEHDSVLYRNLSLIEKETKRCQMIMDNLLRFARKEEVDYYHVNINSVIRDACEIVEHQLQISDVNLTIRLSDNLPMLEGNANQLQQVLMNLMINAQQAMAGKPGEVKVSSRLKGNNRILVAVEDNGPGMSPDLVRRIFEPFFTTKAAGQGTGLGLSVSFGIIQNHGGTIDVESTPNVGSTFTIVLPCSSGRRSSARKAQKKAD